MRRGAATHRLRAERCLGVAIPGPGARTRSDGVKDFPNSSFVLRRRGEGRKQEPCEADSGALVDEAMWRQ